MFLVRIGRRRFKKSRRVVTAQFTRAQRGVRDLEFRPQMMLALMSVMAAGQTTADGGATQLSDFVYTSLSILAGKMPRGRC